MAAFSIRVFIVLAPTNLPRPETIGLDVSVLVFVVAVSVLSGVFFGVAPAWQLSRHAQHEALKEGGRTQTGSTSTRRLRSLLVGTEVACAVLLLCGAGLMLRSFVRLQGVPLGFVPQGVLAFRVVLPPTANESQQAEFCNRALERLQALPGIQRVGATSTVFQNGNADTTILVEGRPSTSSAGEQVMDDAASPDYLATLGVPLRRGRFFSYHDGRTAPHVAIINETFAHRFWPNGDAVGKRFQFGDGRFADPWVTVVGVAGDMRRNGLEREPLSQVFLPFEQLPSRGTDFVVRTNADPIVLAPTVRREIAALDRSVPVYRISTLEQRLTEATAPRRFETLLLGLFAAAALLLAAIGIYGLVHYAVAQRTPEIGIRLALGASRSEVLILVLREGLSLAALGLLVGMLGALGLTRTLSSLLYGVTATDPVTFAVAPLLLAAVVLLACAKPAWQAINVDPIVALHYE
jgi:putative ABC transport system permease protein